MSRAAEERHEVWFAQHLLDCEKNFTVGAKVWRPRYDKLQEGTIRKIAKCKYDHRGDPRECVDGDKTLYAAQFGGTSDYNGDWEDQTYAWKFFWKEEHARQELVEDIKGRIETARRDIQQMEKQVAELQAAGVEDVESW